MNKIDQYIKENPRGERGYSKDDLEMLEKFYEWLKARGELSTWTDLYTANPQFNKKPWWRFWE